ncbi:MAG: HD domain-containing phosphohydrolase [Candidatus Geothermincolales bacterium]
MRLDGKERGPEEMVSLLEEKMPSKRDHWRRVAYYAGLIAERMGLDEREKEAITTAASFMDVGMLEAMERLGINLEEAGALEEEELRVIRLHPLMSERLLSLYGFDSHVLSLVRSHHEWWDGSGYPEGLTGEEIPLGSRILSVADAFVAMTSWRTYRTTMEAKEALRELYGCAGSQFDPQVVKAFLALMTPRIYGMEKDAASREDLELLREMTGMTEED